MAVSKMQDSLSQGSSEYNDNLYCDPCSTLSKQVNAMGHCLECIENLCKACMEYHTAIKFCVNHKLLCEPKQLIYCKICERQTNRKMASGFCLDCRESLCPSCYDYHPRTSATRDHRLVQKKELSETEIETMLSRVKKVPNVSLPTLTAGNIDLCVPCLTKSNPANAMSHCVTCKENLCNDCFHYHLAIAVCSKHELQRDKTIHWCKPCARRSIRSSPYGHCPACEENLCSGCFRYHRGPIATKSHYITSAR